MPSIKHLHITEVEGTVEPVSLEEAKAWLQIDFADHDALLSSLIKASRQKVEGFCNISLVDKKVELYVDLCGEFYELPNGPVASVTTVSKVDGEGTETTLVLGTDYRLLGGTDTFKSIKSYYAGEHYVEYLTGFAVVPDSLKEAILSEVAYRFKNRGDENTKRLSEDAQEKAAPYMRIWL